VALCACGMHKESRICFMMLPTGCYRAQVIERPCALMHCGTALVVATGLIPEAGGANQTPCGMGALLASIHRYYCVEIIMHL